MKRLEPSRDTVVFHSASGPLTVHRSEQSCIMDFPARPCAPVAPPVGMAAALGCQFLEAQWVGFNVVVRLASAVDVRTLSPDLTAISRMPCAGVIVTTSGDADYDCVSRHFAPAEGIPEDPVTGGAHCPLSPFWAELLGKTELHAFQASARSGELRCRLRGNRVELEGAQW